MKQLLNDLQKALIVSCQAQPDWPLYGSVFIQKMAVAAEMGGAKAIRACWPDNIKAIKEVCSLPIIGINKVYTKSTTPVDVIITPTFEAAVEVIETGCEILALDCTPRGRSYNAVQELINKIRKHYPDIVLMADISTVEEGLAAAEMGVEIISTTLAGYTHNSLGISEEEARTLISYPDNWDPEPDYNIIMELRKQTSVLINAEGRFWEIAQVKKAFAYGADMITIGSAITAPQLTTKRFADAIKSLD